jgi:arylsulfatase A-like enzyme
MREINRRDFLKLASMGAGAAAITRFIPGTWLSGQSESVLPNVLIFVFDAMSARNLSLYGYHRHTTPNLERFAERAIVYHQHRSAGNFTSPGTASLLTGMYPWTHRAINQAGLVARRLQDRNIFRLFGREYHRLAYAQNVWADFILGQFKAEIDRILPPHAFSLVDSMIGARLGGSPAVYRAFDEFLFKDGTPPASLVFSLVDRVQTHRRVARTPSKDYYEGLPRVGDYPIFFKLRDVYDGLIETIEALTAPYLAYLHLWSPHDPYKPSNVFIGVFTDHWRPAIKPNHRLGTDIPNGRLIGKRKNYDELIANVDAEFGRLMDELVGKGLLQNTYIVVTSDHGELLERGVEGHITPLLYEPVTQVPLLISTLGQQKRQDVHSPTNSIQLLPSLLHAAGRTVPEWSAGEYLPGMGGEEDYERSTFAVEAKDNRAYSPLKKATVAMYKGTYKLIYYIGYEKEDAFELYDLENDYEELTDLYPARPAVLKSMQAELLEAFETANKMTTL